MITVTPVPYEYVDDAWPFVSDYLDRAARRNKDTYTGEDVLKDIKRKKCALWVAASEDGGKIRTIAAMTTRIVKYPEATALAIDWIGGTRMPEWIGEFDREISRYARDHHCSRIEGTGRHGWIKALEPLGYREWMPTYRKDLVDG